MYRSRYVLRAVLDLSIAERLSLGMYALRERRQHVTQEDFEFAVAKASHIYLELLAAF